MRILVATLMHQLFLQTVQSTLVQDWPEPLDFLYLSGDVDPDADGYAKITDKYERARRQALFGQYDALFCVEADMIIPPDALRKLASMPVDVAYGLYCFRHHPALGMWNAYAVVTERSGASLSHFPDEARATWGHTALISGVGLGCTLIQRRVLEAITFRHAYASDVRPIPVHCDWCLSEDCQALGFTQAMDLTVVCGHIRPSDPRGVIWPDPTAPHLYRIDPLA